jgi:N-carbamoyl-L-amino-acid hydrolase
MTESSPLRIDGARLWDSLMVHARIGGTPDGGINREALTADDAKGRDLFARWCRDEGMELGIDELGTMFATLPGTEPDAGALATGSHLDTQQTGGKFDGVLGVLAGLEVVRTLRQSETRLRHSLTVVNWTAEEGCRFPLSMAASGVYSDIFTQAEVEQCTDRAGVRFIDALGAIGYAGEEKVGARRFKAMLELHIEQGPVLEQRNAEIGVVTGAQAMSFNTVTIFGREAHAGPTPMEARLDPVSAFVRIAAACESKARAIPEARFTVGLIETLPGSHSVIPRELKFLLDLRNPKAGRLKELLATFEAAAEAERTLGYRIVRKEDGALPELAFDKTCIQAIQSAVNTCGYSSHEMVSGAGHDAVYVARRCPTAMIFTPCRGGLRHNPGESITPAQAEAGANVLLHALLNLDRV